MAEMDIATLRVQIEADGTQAFQELARIENTMNALAGEVSSTLAGAEARFSNLGSAIYAASNRSRSGASTESAQSDAAITVSGSATGTVQIARKSAETDYRQLAQAVGEAVSKRTTNLYINGRQLAQATAEDAARQQAVLARSLNQGRGRW